MAPQAQSQSSTEQGGFYQATIGGVSVTANTGIWYHDAGVGSILQVRESDAIVGIPSLTGTSVGNINPRVVTGGESEHYVFSSTLSGSGAHPDFIAMFRADRGGPLDLVIRRGDLATGPNEFSTDFKKPTDTVDKFTRRRHGRFKQFDSESISPDGTQIAFRATLFPDSPSVTSANDTGIWKVDAANQLELVARESHQAPGFAEGICFDRFDDVLIDDDGWVWFRGWLRHDPALGIDSSNDCGIWTNDDGFFRWMAHEGQLAPNTDGGIVLQVNSFSHLGGGLASVLTLSVGTGDVLYSNNYCIVSGFDGPTGLMEINLREGDRLDAGRPALDRFATFFLDSQYNAFGGSGGLCTPVQGSIDRLAFRTDFTGGTAILVRALSDTGP